MKGAQKILPLVFAGVFTLSGSPYAAKAMARAMPQTEQTGQKSQVHIPATNNEIK